MTLTDPSDGSLLPPAVMLARAPHSFGRRWFGIVLLVISAGFFASCHRDPAAVKARYVSSGDRYAAAGKNAEAVLEYRNALQQDAMAGDVREKLGRALLKTGNYPAALDEYIRAADLRSDDTRLQLEAGNLLLLAGRYDDARTRAEKVLARDERNVDAQIMVANALAALKNLDAAITQIEEALRVDPSRSSSYASLGTFELTRGKHEAAERAFLRAVELAPDSVSARLALGNFYWLTGRTAAAEESLTRALEIDPRNPLTNRALANFYLATDRRASAEKPLTTVYSVTKSAASAVALAEYYVTVGRDAAASEILQRMLDDPAAATIAAVRLAALQYKAGSRDEAYRRLKTVLDKDPANLQALLVNSGLLLLDGKLDGALASAKVATDRHPDTAAAFFLLGRVQVARRQFDAAAAAFDQVLRLNPRATEAKVALANLNLTQGKISAAVTFAEEVLAKDPSNADAQLAAVRGLLAEGQLERASAVLADLTKRYPNSATVHNLKGLLLGGNRDYAAARAEFEIAMRLDPGGFDALSGLVELDLAAGDYASARARVDPKLTSGPSAPILLLAARAHAASGDLEAAERLLRQAIQVDGEFLPAYGALGQIYVKQRKLDAARIEFDALAKRQTTPVVALTMAGMLLEAQGDINGARDRFERVIQLDPEAGVAANNLAWIYAENGGNLDVALQLARTAQKRLPGIAEVGDTLGFIYYKKNLAPLAVSTLRVSVQKEPANPVFQYHLGLAYAGAGDTVRAREALERALTLKTDFSGSQDARRLLGSLQLR